MPDSANYFNLSFQYSGSLCKCITERMKRAAAETLAGLVKKPTHDKILLYATDKRVVPAVAKAVKKAWKKG